MTKDYTDFIDAMTIAKKQGHDVHKVVITEETMDVFMADSEMSEADEERHDDLGSFEVDIEQGDSNYVLCENGETFDL